ncbi:MULTISPECIES: Crp/Fnr family transcriptional regulator [unclassified Mesorhizobium]|uniref:Crp/Fnr family transcriptional regulator n=1 Tax=unclassified Mesorhizobium TaxID=325217 RepID=UPI000F759A98|nr:MULTISPECIES: Crp/Fnr family transcriptional regulator [unclassified Mesorhizobium]AZO19882.1 Crp/Fnr family transcriptional regulator [Mesorhizobium sp. M1E.F.Ca.ET.045.02.1.1]RUW38478.1 cyclic nucleotide-binding domain-containing protein [Mesorhizobium sp. M1E.F.Ca.ET.041.01.1.1]RUW85404.1 cyclic nucleotide-binding domain-containing protein [Mesorhizobium sp. M1E.F.Ca.ET.063.01.1.1]RWD90517.1 MAG: cyclic nucleotide-binding domain-containing protein [Mesorhizobium sp.]RWD91770.1 MAG: cycli
MLEALYLNLGQHDLLSDAEKTRLASAMSTEKYFVTGEDIVPIGSRPIFSTLIVDGFAARYKVLENGGRQFTALHVAGDFVDLHAFLLKTMDHGIVALSPCHVVAIEHNKLRAITEQAPHLTRLLWLNTLVDGAIHREWIVAMGRRSKTSHLAHLICELFVRLQVVKKTRDMSFHLPLSQAELADVLGLSVVHMNRVIGTLRRMNVINWTSHLITILDWARLVEIAEFDPTYLSMNREPR